MKTGVLTLVALALLAISLGPRSVAAQGRGRGRNRVAAWDRKCEKFVNCHDARDGRWDNRGPRRRFGSRLRAYSPYDIDPYFYGNRYYGSRDRYSRVYRSRRVSRPERLYIRTSRRW